MVLFDANALSIDNWEGFVKCRKKPVIVNAVKIKYDFTVDSMEGTVKGKAGDYLIIGTRGEKYIIDSGIFESTYDIISED